FSKVVAHDSSGGTRDKAGQSRTRGSPDGDDVAGVACGFHRSFRMAADASICADALSESYKWAGAADRDRARGIRGHLMEHFGYLFAAYSIIFGAIFLYVLFLWRRQASLDADLRALEARLVALTEIRSAEHSANAESPI